jgi:Flp pilus assembly protein protease CpaA
MLRDGLLRAWAAATRAPPPANLARQKDAFPFGIAIALGTYMTVASMHLGQHTPANLVPEYLLGR